MERNKTQAITLTGITVIVAILGLFKFLSHQTKLEDKLAQATLNLNQTVLDIEKDLVKYGQPLQKENVIGDSAPESFYMVNGKRAYTRVDGKLLGDYLEETPGGYQIVYPNSVVK